MNFTMAGVILFTQNYEECVNFYGDILELEMLHKIDRVGEQLTTFNLGDTYLMVETGGIAHGNPKTIESSPIKFRFNVPNVKATCDELRSKGIAVEVFDHTWGMTAEFHDPDGNCCALRSDKGFGE
jgi:lactoylglutathione lyase